MVKKEIALLEAQIEKLKSPDFDLDAWKKYTLIILMRIFGEDDEKTKQLKNIDFEFNSWSLRDASGNESYEEGTKKLATEILQAAIDELKIYGLPKSKDEEDSGITRDLLNIILDELKGSQVKELSKILASRDNKTEKQRRVNEIIKEIGEYSSYETITNILTNPSISALLKNMK